MSMTFDGFHRTRNIIPANFAQDPAQKIVAALFVFRIATPDGLFIRGTNSLQVQHQVATNPIPELERHHTINLPELATLPSLTVIIDHLKQVLQPQNTMAKDGLITLRQEVGAHPQLAPPTALADAIDATAQAGACQPESHPNPHPA